MKGDWHKIAEATERCTGVPLDQLHPYSFKFLNEWYRGLLYDWQLEIVFSLPNSDYLGAAQCIISSVPG